MLIVEIRGDQVWRRIEGQGSGAALPDPEFPHQPRRTAPSDVITTLADWAGRYGRAAAAGAESAQRDIGVEIFAWLDQGGALAGWLAGQERALEIRIDPAHPHPLAEPLLAAPWEVLCHAGRFLAADTRLFVVARRCGGSSAPPPPRHAELDMLFMAAAPAGQSDLDYEAEETAILEATRADDGRAPLAHVQVEESGTLEFLAGRLRLDGPFEALHLSCHGDILLEDGQRPAPLLLLETPEGKADAVSPDDLIRKLPSRDIPPLVFVSACRTAERGAGRKGLPQVGEGYRKGGLAEAPAIFDPAAGQPDAGGTETGAPPDLAEPFVRRLAVHVPNVLGWDGSVSDRDATMFAKALYGDLAHGETVPHAAARARRELLDANACDPRRGRHWHLARVYLGPGGGGPLCDPHAQARPARPHPEHAFLDPKNKRVPVATRAEFVGRRRHIQQVLAAYRSGLKCVLIHGMGNLGKSSLAARVAARMPRHRPTVVFGQCHALAIFTAVKNAIEEIADRMSRLDRKILLGELEEIEQEVANNERALEGELRRLLRGILHTHPVLLVLDDLEQSLEEPSADQPDLQPKPGYRDALVAVLSAFANAVTESRLLLTSRYNFVLPNGAGDDLAAGLVRVGLTPMGLRERRKQVLAKARAGGAAEAAAHGLVETALAAAAGNPGLQDTLTRPILAGEAAAAQAAIAAVEAFRATGEQPPLGGDLGDFFQRMAFSTYAGALNGAEKVALAAATLFSQDIPVPRPALEAAAAELGVADPARAVDRLLALGLLDDWGEMALDHGARTTRHAAANPLARPLADALSEAEAKRIAAAALAPLAIAWRDADGDFPYDARAVEATGLALLAGAPDLVLLAAAAEAAVVFLYDFSDAAPAAVALARPVLATLAAAGHLPGILLLLKTIDAAARVGDVNLHDQLLEQALARADIEQGRRALFLLRRAERLLRLGSLPEARTDLDQALTTFKSLSQWNLVAWTKFKIAYLLRLQDELPEAQLLFEQALAAFKESGEPRSVDLVNVEIAEILRLQGKLPEARTLLEEMRAAFEVLGDRRQIAVIKGKIAEILRVQGEPAKALGLLKDALAIFEDLSDRRAAAVAKGEIAKILLMQGEPAEAEVGRLLEQVLAAFEELGDRRHIAVTKGRIADLLERQGQVAESRRLLEQEVLPVYEALGDQRSVAVTKGHIAAILRGQGDLPGALALHIDRSTMAREGQDMDTVAHALLECALLRFSRGEDKSDGIQKIFEELSEAYTISLGLQRPDLIGWTGGLLGQILARCGNPDTAKVFANAAAAFDKIGESDLAAECRRLIEEIRGGVS